MNRLKTIQAKICLTAMLFTGSVFFSYAQQSNRGSDSLDYYIRLATENNPGIKSESIAHEAYLERLSQAGTLPDPELSLETYTMPMEIIGGKSLGNISLMQSFPWFGVLKAARIEAKHNANVQKHQVAESVNEIIFQVRTKWYEVQKLQEQLRNNQENKSLLQQLEQLAVRMYSSPSRDGQSGMSEVLRIQMEIAEIDNNVEGILAQMKMQQAVFNALLNRNADEEVHWGTRLVKDPYVLSDAQALVSIADNNPLLEKITEEGLAYKAKGEKDVKMSNPMIGVGVQYMLIGKTDNMLTSMGHMNGKDMIMPMVSLSLPIFRNKYQAQQRENEKWRQATEENYKNTLNGLKSEYYTLRNRMDDEERKMKLYEKQATLAQTTYALIVKEFATGKSNLTNILDVQRQLLSYQLKKAESVADYNTIIASLQKLLAIN